MSLIHRLRLGARLVAAISIVAFALPSSGAEIVPALDHESLFDRDRLIEVEIELPDEDWDKLRRQSRQMASALMKPPPPNPYSFFKADVTIDGTRINGVGVRKKGFIGSQDEVRPSLKIKFNEFDEGIQFDGIDRLTLNNNKQDRALVSQTMTYKLFADAGLPASRCNLAKVTVNGQFLGIYSHVESVKAPMLKRVFGDDSGKLYEGTLADFFVGRVNAFESKTTDGDENREELSAVAELLETDDFDLDELTQHIDLAEFTKYWALESLIDFWDGYTNNQNNFFVYHSPTDGKFHFLPWGADASMLNSPMYRQFQSGPESVHGKSVLANRLYSSEGGPDRYRAVLTDLMETVWQEEKLLAEIDRIQQLVEGHTHESQSDYQKAMDQTRDFIKKRRKLVERELRRWPLKIASKPREPIYTSKVGTASGTFTTTWMAKPPKDVYGTGEAELEVNIDGKPLELVKLGVHATYSQMPGPDGKKPPTVAFVGKRKSNGIRVTLGVSADENSFSTVRDTPVTGQGMLLEGAGFGFFFNPKGFRMLGGTVTFAEAGTSEGDVVRGEMQVEIVEFKGQMR